MQTPAAAAQSPLFTRSFRKVYPRAVRGEKAWLWDSEGNRYLDFSGSAAVCFIGHGDAHVAQAVADQLGELEFAHTSQFVTPVAEEFARELLDFAGPAFRGGAVYFTSGGSEAVETALKLARQFQVDTGQPERHQFISRRQSYHGATLGALAVSGNRRRRDLYSPMLPEVAQVNTPYCYRCPYECRNCAEQHALELERAIAAAGRSAAAFICEPVSGATLGAAVPPDGYMQRIRQICDTRGLLWIADEVMTGCGRTGRNFACEHWQVAPDLLVTAKGLASGYAPLGAVIASARVVQAIAQGSGAFVHGFTYNAHPVALAAGRAALRRARELDLFRAADAAGPASTASHLRQSLASLRECRSVGDVRGLGLLWGVEFVADRTSKQPYARETEFASRVAAAAARRGVLVYPMQGCMDGLRGDHLLIAPPAVITDGEIADATTQLRLAILEAEQSLQS